MNIKELKTLVEQTIKEERLKTEDRFTPHQKKLRESLRRAKLILEGDEEKKEEGGTAADPSQLDTEKFPLKLSDVAGDVELAEKLVTSGDGASDAIGVKPDSWSAAELSPSQTSMNLPKACWFALGMLNGSMFGSGGPGGKTNAFVSQDNYLMDGHHRWIATAMADPSASIEGFKVDWPAKQLVAVLNTVTVGLLGVTQGKPGTGGFEQFQKLEEIEGVLTKMLTDEAPSPKGGTFKGVAGDDSAGKAKEVIEKATGLEGEEAAKAMAKQMYDNLQSVPGAKGAGAVMPGAPERIDMPVIDDDKSTKNTPSIDNTIKALKDGEINVNEGFRRWNKLAGILTD
tara:strand:+ start:3700 stop:4725 length:1026 start_codon:yes stop_codon:yes gene_type:complete